MPLEQRADVVVLPAKPSLVRQPPVTVESKPPVPRDARSMYFTHGAYATAGADVPKLKAPATAPAVPHRGGALARAATSNLK